MFDKYLTKTGRLSCKQPQEIKDQWHIQKFQQVHGYTYDYSRVHYTLQLNTVEIVCKIHGSFHQRPGDHLEGKGCPHCQDCRQAKTTSQCIQEFVQVHGDVYDYSRVLYINSYSKVDIICKHHGCFSQRPNDHIAGKGCPKCQNHNQNTLYILRCQDTGLVKIGITNNLKKRMSSIGGSLEHIFSVTVDNPRQLEKQLHNQYQQYSVPNTKVRSGGTEFFNLTLEQVQEIICSFMVKKVI